MDLLYTAHVPRGEGPFPTLVVLHGWGASAHDLLGLAPFFNGGEALILCPQGPVEMQVGPGLRGYGWFPLTAGAPPDPAAFQRGLEAIQSFLKGACARYPVNSRKLALLGFSQGGVMAYSLALRDPARFAGLAALSSWLPGALASAIPVQPEHKNLPVFVSHGTQDPMIGVERGRESRDALLRLGVPLTFHEYEMGHEVRPETLRDLVRWLDEKVWNPIQLL